MSIHSNSKFEYPHFISREFQGQQLREDLTLLRAVLPDCPHLVERISVSVEDILDENQHLQDERKWSLQEPDWRYPDCPSKADSSEYEQSAERLRIS
ncbi:hypothetical protein [Trichormus variabilis]|uniref:Uncharacterized protein n=1 Tax=Trichormus variabilis SAG 1403-4b TaxID=447716 RepID=A0A433UST6_ANAVA|nr:hypothetical protein [Trichormus variabilis]MBD2628202.1 hypothetical protein [Trichormus variabilis FACHB-164]RUS96922.1 hypothetical protein DSM107003_23280 [Trichormus variabilis SAG 1403-4b]